MTRLVSLGTKIKQIHGLIGTKDVNTWEASFIESVWEWSAKGDDTPAVTAKQAEIVERIWSKHFS